MGSFASTDGAFDFVKYEVDPSESSLIEKMIRRKSQSGKLLSEDILIPENGVDENWDIEGLQAFAIPPEKLQPGLITLLRNLGSVASLDIELVWVHHQIEENEIEGASGLAQKLLS